MKPLIHFSLVIFSLLAAFPAMANHDESSLILFPTVNDMPVLALTPDEVYLNAVNPDAYPREVLKQNAQFRATEICRSRFGHFSEALSFFSEYATLTIELRYFVDPSSETNWTTRAYNLPPANCGPGSLRGGPGFCSRPTVFLPVFFVRIECSTKGPAKPARHGRN